MILLLIVWSHCCHTKSSRKSVLSITLFMWLLSERRNLWHRTIDYLLSSVELQIKIETKRWRCKRQPPFSSPSSTWSFAQVRCNVPKFESNKISGFLCQFREFRGAGLSPEAFLSFGDWLGSEEIRWLRFCCLIIFHPTKYLSRFVRFHMKRTAGTLVLHSLLPIGTKKGK